MSATQTSQATNGSQTQSDRMVKLRLGEKLGYGVGDAGFNLYWMCISSFLLAFYTDVFGISAAAAGTMLFTTKIIDACTDPLMGAIADRTKTRFGKFRPYLIWAGLPMAGAAVLTFTTPDLDDTGKLIWAYGTYTLMMVMYTVLSTPYSALSGVMTASSQDRTSLISIRFIFAFSCATVVNAMTLDIVQSLGDGDDTKGWQMTMMLYGLIAAVLFAVTFMSTKERIAPAASQQSNPVEDIRDLLKNRPWLILFALAMIIMMTITMRGGSAYYYFMYFVERPDLLGKYLGVQAIAYAIGAACAPLMTRFLDKAKLLMLLMAIVGTFSVAFTFVPKPEANGVVTIESNDSVTLNAADLFATEAEQSVEYQWYRHEKAWWIFSDKIVLDGYNQDQATFENKDNWVVSVERRAGETLDDSSDVPVEIILMFVFNIIISLALGPKSPLTWSMYADTADYNEWKTGKRATAMTFSAATFAQKIGGALGSACIAWVLGVLGYVANQAQSGASEFGIVLVQTAFPGFFALLAVVITRYYTLTGSQLEQIQQELKSRDEVVA